ncbi:integrase [Mycobacterium riyadhense]|uniref:integrase n=1 Tax=Mycobacterium riyadhense TaxID=486698 RepID=UPI00195BD6B1|nr:integrase [Mycobacterium riyadhense]
MEKLAAQLDPQPQWWAGFGEFLAARAAATRAISMLHRLAAALDQIPTANPTTVLAAVRNPGPAVGELARALETYFVDSGLALALDTTTQAASVRRARRIAEVPDQFRSLATTFDAHQLQSRDRARRSGTKPRSDRTLEINLAAIRDLARYLNVHRPAVTDWTLVGTGDIEAFLATITNQSYRARQLHALQSFFRFARQQRHILADPTRRLNLNSNMPFHGQVLEPTRQRELFHRWTADTADLHPHEPVIGLLALLHGASGTELRALRVKDIDLNAASAALTGRPHQTPLDPATTTALRRCLRYRDHQHSSSPWLLVNQKSRTVGKQVSPDYLNMILGPAQVRVQALRTTRLAQLVTVMDPVLVAAAFGIRRGTALHYLADTVDAARLPDL